MTARGKSLINIELMCVTCNQTWNWKEEKSKKAIESPNESKWLLITKSSKTSYWFAYSNTRVESEKLNEKKSIEKEDGETIKSSHKFHVTASKLKWDCLDFYFDTKAKHFYVFFHSAGWGRVVHC